MLQPDMGTIFHIKINEIFWLLQTIMEVIKIININAFILLGYKRNTDASILVYKYRPERTGFNMYVENTQLQLTFLTLLPWFQLSTLFTNWSTALEN